MRAFLTLLTISSFLLFPVGGAATTESVLLPPLEESITISDWHIVGPFLSGAREPLANPMGAAFDPVTGSVDLSATYPSVHSFGGRVAWQETTTNESGDLVFSFDEPDWEKINDEWGVSGVSFLAAAYSTFECGRTCRALVNAHSIGSFYINGRRYSGDPYGHRLIKTPVILDEGENRVFFMTGGWAGSDTVRFEIEPPPDEAIMVLERDILLPDVVRGEESISYGSVPILNTTNQWIKGVTIVGHQGDVFLGLIQAPVNVPPLCLVEVPVHVGVTVPPPELREMDQVDSPLTVIWEQESVEILASLRVKNPDDSRRVTFVSAIDSSVQKYSVRYPTDFDPAKRYSLILALHGAGVECDGLVDSFEPRNWAFIVAPTNRRRFGFDWQDWGRLDALEVLDECLIRYPIDRDRVYLVGHSMGGHGTWHVGCTHADLFATITPSAGWASFQLYVPWFLRADEMFSDPDCRRVFEAVASPDRTERLLPNLLNTPVLAVHGGDDDNVPPTHARLLTGILEQMGYDVRYWEEPGQGHWWDSDPDLPGAHCVDAPRIRSFMREHVRDPYPRHVILATYDLGNTNSKYWLEVDEEISPIGLVYVDAELGRDGVLRCVTRNVRQITFGFSPPFPHPVPIAIEIDGQVLKIERGGAVPVTLANPDGTWQVGRLPSEGLRKTPEFRGPIKRVFFNPFIIVVGTCGSDDENELNMEIARNLSQRWWYRANGYCTIARDVDVWEETFLGNLVLVGGPSSNSVSAGIADQLPIRVDTNGVWLGDKLIQGDDLAVKFVYPSPLSPGRLIYANWGTSLEGTRLAGSLTCLFSGSNLPDFLVYDDAVRLMGYAGVRAAGFFDNSWQLDPDLYYLRY